MRGDIDPPGIFRRGKAFRFLRAALALGAVSLPPWAWAGGAGAAGDASPCPVDSVPIEIMTPGYGSEIMHSPAEIPDSLQHFRAFVTVVTAHVAARLAWDKLCIKGAEGMNPVRQATATAAIDTLCAKAVGSMNGAAGEKRSLLQFVHWRFAMGSEFLVPVLSAIEGAALPRCRISSPWIDLDIIREPVPQIRGIVRWNERQMLADQAVLAGAKTVPQDMAMPLTRGKLFLHEYIKTEIHPRRPAAQPIEARIPTDLLWLYRRSRLSARLPAKSLNLSMREATEKGAEGYTQLVLALIDRCFVAGGAKPTTLNYHSILDAADLIPLERYRIDMPLIRRNR